MAENRRPSQRYLSGRVKVSKNAGLGTDRHLYISPSDVEPNLGYPGEKSIPISGSYYRLVTIPNGTTYDRYWQTDSPATLVNGISIFDEGTLVGTANTVSKINFVGSAITATASGTISTVSVSPPGTDKQVLFNDLDDFGAASQLFYDKSSNRIGIGVSNPTQQLHLNGDFRITGRIWDQHNQVGGASSVLIATGTGVSWSSSAGANVQISPNAPSNAVSGDLWWDSEDGDLNVYYEDADSSAWVSANANADQEDGRWTLDSIGIHTTSNVGIGTTMASVALAVGGNAIFGGALGGTGIVTATEFHGTFIGNATGTTGGGRWALNSAGIHTTKNVGIGSTLPNALLDVRGNSSFTGLTTFRDDVTFKGANYDILWDQATSKIKWNDNAQATFGDANDLQIYHQGNKSFIKNNNNVDYLHLQSDKISLAAESAGENFLVALKDGSVELFYDSSKRIETTGAGVSITGGVETTGLSTFTSIELDSTLIDIHGQVGAARSVLTATGAGVSWGQGGSGVKIDEDPPTGNYDADLWWESDTGEMHIWYDDGSSAQWVSVSQGPAGPQGATGAQGHQGVQGSTGSTGAQGHQGVQGAQGATGAQGVQGSVGAQGHQGVQGAQGHQGVQGATGSVGAQGATGAQGHQGVQGAGGSTGGIGAQGVQGAQGHQGHQGRQGATGNTGSGGAQGAQGYQGVQGAAGSATISNNADNRVITGGSGTNLNGESNLLFDGTTLSTGGSGTGTLVNIGDDGVTNTKILQIKRTSSKTTIPNIQGVNAGVGAAHFELQGEGGNVAIGDVTPTEKLHVSGGVRITGAIKDKDDSAGSSGQVLSSTGSQIDWVNPTPTASFVSYAILKHVESSGTHAGGSTSSWGTRPLNQETADPHNIVTLSSNQFTLGAGNYLIRFGATSWDVQDACLRIYDVTNSASRGESANGYGSSYGERNTWTQGVTRVTPTGSTVYRLEQISDQARGTYGWGHSNSLGSTEEYAQVEIFKEG